MLTVRNHMALTIAAQRFRPGALETATRHQLGLSEPRFWQVVNSLIDTQSAQEAYPAVCRRLRSLREQRRLARSA